MDSPNIHTHELERVNNSATSVDDKNFVISRGDKAYQFLGQRDVSTANELADAIQELEKAGKLPAVLHVHTARPPFGHSTGIDYALGKGGGWHVINIHGYDPATRSVKFTNQWGSKHDFLEQGYSVDKLFEAMKQPKMHALREQHKDRIAKVVKIARTTGKVVAYGAGAGAAVYGGYKLAETYIDEQQK